MKICFVAHNAYAALCESRLDHVGGVERQQALMARWLADHDHEVSVITWGREAEDTSPRPDVCVEQLCKKSDGVPVLRFFYPRWSSLIGALRAVDADVYYYNLGDLVLGQLVMWTRLKGKTSVYSVSSEPKCLWDLSNVLSFRERVFYRHGLRNVDEIIVQTQRQRSLIQQEYGRYSTVLPMPCLDLSVSHDVASFAHGDDRPKVLWVGRFSAEKRPHLILEIAARCPDIQFDVIGQANRITNYANQFVRDCEKLENIALLGVVQHDQIGKYYSRSQALLCTSIYEGFPNVFLEAWSVGLPTVTTFDPDSIVANNKIGFHESSVERISNRLKSLLFNEICWNECARNARHFFIQNHEFDGAMRRFEEVLTSAASQDDNQDKDVRFGSRAES